MSAYYAPSVYTISNTMELNSKCLKNASPTNSTNQKENLVPFLVRPMKPQKTEKQNTTTNIMKQQMIHGLPTTMTHNTLVNKSETPNSQIITREYLIPSYGPNKKRDSPRGLNFPNVFPGKDTKRGLATDYKAIGYQNPHFSSTSISCDPHF